MEPFLDFYRAHGVAPVHYKVDGDFVARRLWLYAKLGVAPSSVRGNSVLEFGPGTGDNSVVVAGLKPQRYVLVDANPSSLSYTSRAVGELDFVEVVESRVQDYVARDDFDLVLAENIVPGQREPVSFARHVLNFVRPGGVAIITTHTEAGLLADICRQLLGPEIRRRVAANSVDGPEKLFKKSVELGAGIFSADLASLGSTTRSPSDWVIDNILHDWLDQERIFTPRSALASLPPDVDFMSSSPAFGGDTRWFKAIAKDSPRSMPFFVEQIDRNIPALLDYRVPIGTEMKNPEEARDLLFRLFEIRDLILSSNDYTKLSGFLENLQMLAEILPEASKPTRAAIRDFADSGKGIESFVDGRGEAPNRNWPNFSKWWGRATVFSSFWRMP